MTIFGFFGNNRYMSKALDYVSLTIILLLSTFAWSTLFLPGWIYPLIFSSAFSAIVVYSVRRVLSKKNKPCNYDRLALELSVRGSEYLINLIKSTLKNDKIESGSNYIILNDAILIAAYKFGVLNISDLGNILQLAGKHEKKQVFVMTRGADRRAFQALQLDNNVSVSLIKIKQIYKYLDKHNALPALKTPKRKFRLSAFLEVIFQRSNTKNYIFSGVILIAIAFLTPLKIYYLILGSLSLGMALLTLTPIGKGSFKASKAFDMLEASAKADEKIKEGFCGDEHDDDKNNSDENDCDKNALGDGDNDVSESSDSDNGSTCSKLDNKLENNQNFPYGSHMESKNDDDP